MWFWLKRRVDYPYYLPAVFKKRRSKMTQGMKTSEFWISGVLPFLMVLLNHWLGWGLTPGELAAGGIGSGSYAISRGIAK